ncbi:hypothetical protein FACS189432_06720 [Bacteroidia bacterium]|nr:hypothetical protein FACS189432_06720 [Bacteroidia bacterium]
MKKLFYILLAGLFTMACDPIQTNDSMGSLLSESEINIDVDSITPGSNKIVLINNTPGIAVYWNYIVGASTLQNDTVLLPFIGTQTISFTAICGGGQVTVTKDVKIEQIDYPLNPIWDLLAGSDADGKTWVWATGSPETGWASESALYGNGSTEDIVPAWWILVAGDLDAEGQLYNEMTFDLNGGANFTLIEKGVGGTATPKVTKDAFILDVNKKTVRTANGTPYLRGESFTNGTLFNIAKITENELTLVYTYQGAENYIWRFKRKGYEY